MVGQCGLEPQTSRLSGACSNHLSYWPTRRRGILAPAGPPAKRRGPPRLRGEALDGFLAATYSPGLLPSTIGAAGLTAVFGMGTGVSPTPWPPEMSCRIEVGGTSVRDLQASIRLRPSRRNFISFHRRGAAPEGWTVKPIGSLVPVR